MKALIVRFSAIGDCVMAVPVAASIREKYPDAHIAWAVEPWCASVIESKTLVNNVAIFPRDEWQNARWSPATWMDQLRRYMSLRKAHFDIGIDLQGQSKTALCLRLAKPAKRLAIKSHDFLSEHLNPVQGVERDAMHTVEANLLGLSRLGDFSRKVQFVMPDLTHEQRAIRDLLPKGRLATISVGAGSNKKKYPLDKWAEVGRQLIAEGFRVAYLGSAKDPPSPLPEATNLVGNLTLTQAMAAITMSDIHLAADTGSGHIAAAYKIPVLSVFGATPVKTFRPYTDNAIVLDGEGSPSTITPEQVVHAVDILLKRHSEAISS